MYNNFFGFKERPFQLVPNPGYLFLSKSHEEAIAHLNYAVSHGDGFVAITGEVGTGKTTLCRAFLEDLDKNTEVAYIFNPRLNSMELLRTINDEFGIDSKADNPKDLIDSLNTFLIELKSRDKNAILLIDEAQNLSTEVLEQLRLLSNLETNTSKLIQIILVGQPELRKILDSYELRQMNQRITLNWYLTPLTRKETREYIRHRVNIASNKTEDKFTPAAYYRIHHYSGGIPRLINIASDRALLTAFGFNKRKVTGTIAGNAINELKSRGGKTPLFFTKEKILAGTLAVLCLALIAVFVFKTPGIFQSTPAEKKNTPPAVSQPGPVTNPGPVKKTAVTFEEFLGNLTNRSSRFDAVNTSLSLWETTPSVNRILNNMDDDAAFFQLAATQNNFQLLQIDNDLDLVKKLNLPAVLALFPPGASSPRYLTMVKMTEMEMTLKGGEKEDVIRVTPGEMKSYWSGTAYIPWKDFLNCKGDIPYGAPKESVFTLKMMLRDIGFTEIPLDYEYDGTTRAAVEQIQERHGIEVDGIVGARTKIAVYNEKKDLKIPHIRAANEPPDGEKQ